MRTCPLPPKLPPVCARTIYGTLKPDLPVTTNSISHLSLSPVTFIQSIQFPASVHDYAMQPIHTASIDPLPRLLSRPSPFSVQRFANNRAVLHQHGYRHEKECKFLALNDKRKIYAAVTNQDGSTFYSYGSTNVCDIVRTVHDNSSAQPTKNEDISRRIFLCNDSKCTIRDLKSAVLHLNGNRYNLSDFDVSFHVSVPSAVRPQFPLLSDGNNVLPEYLFRPEHGTPTHTSDGAGPFEHFVGDILLKGNSFYYGTIEIGLQPSTYMRKIIQFANTFDGNFTKHDSFFLQHNQLTGDWWECGSCCTRTELSTAFGDDTILLFDFVGVTPQNTNTHEPSTAVPNTQTIQQSHK